MCLKGREVIKHHNAHNHPSFPLKCLHSRIIILQQSLQSEEREKYENKQIMNPSVRNMFCAFPFNFECELSFEIIST